MKNIGFLLWVAALLVVPVAAEAAPVGIALAWVGAVAAGTYGVAAAFALRIGVSLALSALAAAMKKQPDSAVQQRSGIKTDATSTGGVNPQSFVLGLYATAGNMVAPPYSGPNSGDIPNKFLTYVVDVSDIAGAQLSRLMVAGEYVDDLEPSETVHDLEGMVINGKPRVFVTWHDGTQTAADPYMLANYSDDPDRPWSEDMIGTGVAYAVITFVYTRAKFNNLPGVRFEVVGIPVYDPRLDSTVGGSGAHRWGDPATYEPSGNPLVLVYNILRGISFEDGSVWGGRAKADDLPLDNWFAAMNECDVQIELEGGGTEPQYRAGLEVGVDETPAAIIEELLKTASAEVSEIGGTYKVRVGPPALPVYFFTDDDVVVTAAESLNPYPGLDGVHNAIHANYPAPDALWETRDAPALYNAEWEAEDGGRQLVADVSLPAAYSGTQVQRLMQAWINDERRFRRHSLTLPPDAAILEPLDVAAWTSASNGYTSKAFEIAELGDDLTTVLQSISIREREAGDFVWVPGTDERVIYHPPTTVTVPAARTVPGWDLLAAEIVDASGAQRRPALALIWDGSDMEDASGLEFEVRPSTQTALVAQATITDLENSRHIVSDGILPGQVYQSRGRLVVRGRARAWTGWASAIAPDLRLADDDISPALDDRISTGEQVRADHDELVAGFDGTLADLAVDAAAAQAAATASETYRNAAQAAQTAAELARQNAETSETNASDSATAAAGSASTATASETAAGVSATAASASSVTATAARDVAAATAAIIGPAVLSAPAAQWSDGVAASASILRTATIHPFITDDPDFGDCLEFAVAGNKTIGHAYPFPWSDTAVLEVRALFKVASTDAGGASARLGGSVQAGTTQLESNVQGTTLAPIWIASGVVELVGWFSRRALADMPNLPGGVEFVGFSALADGGDLFYPHFRQNPIGTSAVLRVGTLQVRDVTARVDAMLEAEAAGGSATAAVTSAAAASASETAAGQSAAATTTAQLAAETAQGLAETARDAAVSSETNALGSANAAATSAVNSATSATGAGASATAASGSASAAATSATAAGTSATAASTSEDIATTAAGLASVSATNAATSSDTASGAAISAAASQSVAALLTSRGIAINPAFSDWTAADPVGFSIAAGEGTATKNTTDAKYENCVELTTAATPTENRPQLQLSGGVGSPNFTHPAQDAGRIHLRAEVELVSGNWDGARLLAQWLGTSTVQATARMDTGVLSGEIGTIQTFSAILSRPEAYVQDTAGDTFRAYVQATSTGGNGHSAKRIRVHSFDVSIIDGTAESTLYSAAQAVGDMQSAAFVARVSAGGASAGLEMVAADDPTEGPTSSILFDADNVLIPQTLRARHMIIDENLDIDSANGAFRMGKSSAADATNDGIFLGRTDEGGGVTGFGFKVGRVADGSEEYIRHTKADGLKIKNAVFLIGAGTSANAVTEVSQTIELNPASVTLSLEMQAGGGGRAGTADGGDTIIVLKDGTTTIDTWTASGGAVGGGNLNASIIRSTMTPNGDGAPGVSGVASYYRCLGGQDEWCYWTQAVPGIAGGAAGQFLSFLDLDISGLTDPKLEVTIGAAGSASAGAGKLAYAESGSAEIAAGPVAFDPAATGSFSVAAGVAGSFPVLTPARGLWVVSGAPTNWRIDAGAGPNLRRSAGNMTFIANKTPVWNTTHTQSITVYYQFFPM